MSQAIFFFMSGVIFLGLTGSDLALASINAKTHTDFVEKAQLELQLWQKNPKAFMQKMPTKTHRGTFPRPRALFSEQDMASGDFVQKKSYGSESWYQTLALPGRWDQPTQVVEEPDQLTGSLDLWEQNNWLSGQVQQAPWSGYYWPIYQGQIAFRYGLGHGLLGDNWLSYFYHTIAPGQSLHEIWITHNDQLVARLSPAEKYDLLLGIDQVDQFKEVWQKYYWEVESWPRGFLTPKQWGVGQGYVNRAGEVENWMGLCHGWAPASYLVSRPRKTVWALAANGQTWIPFFPADIRALITLFWATTSVKTGFAGIRCNVKDPAVDEESGRVTEPNCFDSNPSTWHKAVVHQLGRQGQSLIMDATFDYEVWNQPLISYQYLYFNPITFRTGNQWKEQTVSAKEYESVDWLRKYRYESDEFYLEHPELKPAQFVGVAMEVEYASESPPRLKLESDETDDSSTKVLYLYDLEVNKSGEVIGGEWYQNLHPDFLWYISPKTYQAKSHYTKEDRLLEGEWSPDSILPSAWQEAARQVAVKKGKPLARIVEALVKASK